MARHNFDPSTLDTLFEDAEIIDDNGNSQVPLQIESSDNSMIESNSDVNVDNVYRELEQLISVGNDILKTAKYAADMDPTADGVLAGTASMLNAVKDTVKEFTKIHLQKLKFEQQKELELIKQAGRERIVELRKQTGEDISPVDMVPFNQESVVEIINKMDSETASPIEEAEVID